MFDGARIAIQPVQVLAHELALGEAGVPGVEYDVALVLGRRAEHLEVRDLMRGVREAAAPEERGREAIAAPSETGTSRGERQCRSGPDRGACQSVRS